jgi:hypothetical protein
MAIGSLSIKFCIFYCNGYLTKYTIENLETKRYLFSDGSPIKGDRGAEGGWLASSGFASPNVVGADANYYNRAYWKIIPSGEYFLIENSD